MQEGLKIVESNPHPRLWRLIAEFALEKLDFKASLYAFVQGSDYQGIQFVKRLQKINVELVLFQDSAKQKAEVAAYFSQFEEAEKLYLDMDRKVSRSIYFQDLAIDLRSRLGDWFRVIQLIKAGGGVDDNMLEQAWNSIGDYYYDRQKWSQAITYYTQGRHTERLIECYYLLDDFSHLEKVSADLNQGSLLLRDLATKFVTVGLCDQAASAYIKAGDVKAAVETCIYLNQVSS